MFKYAPSIFGLFSAIPKRDATGAFCTRLVNGVKDAIVVQDLHSHILWMNRAAEDMFGCPLEDIRGAPGVGFIDGQDREAEFCYDLGSSIFDRHVVARHVRRNGTAFWNQQSFAVVDPVKTEKDPMVIVTCRDVTEQIENEIALRQAKVELQHAAYHDDLTGLANRKLLKKVMDSGSAKHALTQSQMGVLHLDLDEFKEINDTLGHAAGDATLNHISDALRRACGPYDMACRSGGDEFLLVCLKVTSEAALLERAELVMKEILRPMRWQDRTLLIKGSIGASIASDSVETGEALIHQADQALYEAKAAGRAQIVMYSPQLGERHTTNTRLARDIQEALLHDQLAIMLQPQMQLSDGRITGCEALMRWNHPQFGQLCPCDFLEVARRSGVLADLDYRAMNLSLDALADLRRAGFDDITLSLNVSTEILSDVNYTGLLDWALQSRGLCARDICIEILGTTILQSGDFMVTTTVDRLRRMGARVALNDFGTGYAGLAHMSAIDIDEVKLDRSMIARLETDARSRAIVSSVIDLSKELSISFVAEGVETPAQIKFLQAAGCPRMQGYALAKPMPIKTLITWLSVNAPLLKSWHDLISPSATAPPAAVTLAQFPKR